ncbi:MAG: discoidin domain-containing protein [Gemmatimonadetes bacterium]|nr:discoidin domain-containing protein [Gemmatimonadota bacterium]
MPDDIERNWAREGKASQSSVAFGGEAARAIDGNRDGTFSATSVTHTAQESEPYWQGDLGAAHYIDEIRIYNRTDCCGDRLKQLMVFWVNNTTGFAGRSINALMAENTGGVPATAVYFKPIFNQAGDIDPVTQLPGPVTTIRLKGDDCGLAGQPGCLVRFLRIQLAGQGPLSLAEVEVVEKGRIAGPALVDDAVTWAPTGIITKAPGVGMATPGRADPALLPGRRRAAPCLDNLADGPVVAGSPALGVEAPAVALSEAQDRAFVAVRNAPARWRWPRGRDDRGAGVAGVGHDRARERGPRVATGCGRAVVAWTDGRRLTAAWKAVSDAPGAGGARRRPCTGRRAVRRRWRRTRAGTWEWHSSGSTGASTSCRSRAGQRGRRRPGRHRPRWWGAPREPEPGGGPGRTSCWRRRAATTGEVRGHPARGGAGGGVAGI